MDTEGIYTKYLFYFSYSENKIKAPNKASIHLEYFPNIVGNDCRLPGQAHWDLNLDSQNFFIFSSITYVLCAYWEKQESGRDRGKRGRGKEKGAWRERGGWAE